MKNKYTHSILLVDDEEGILNALRRLLKALDAKVVTAPNAEAALELVENGGFSLIVSDQRMPGLSGVELLQQVRKISPDTIRILLTGYADIDATVRAINEGAVKYYLNKPGTMRCF